jgi:hypothetical protein
VKNVFLAGFIFLCFSCIDNSIPEYVLSKEKMTAILIDVHVAEAKAAAYNLLTVDSAAALFSVMEAEIYKKHKVDKKAYKKSYEYYMKRPELFEQIYNSVIDSLTVRQAKGEVK